MNPKIIKCDLYRMKKSKLFYGAVLGSIFIALSLVLVNRQDIRLGISIFGNLTMFVSIEDIMKLGIAYQKGLGLIIAIFVSAFIGQEYQWNTWQHKWMIGKSRQGMYLSKNLLSVVLSIFIFLNFELTVLVCSGKVAVLLENGWIKRLTCGIFIYAALGSVLCMISMLIKSSTVSITLSLGYVVCAEMGTSIMENIVGIFQVDKQIIREWSRHTIYGMSVAANHSPITNEIIFAIMVSSFCIIVLTTWFGIWKFCKYEF